MKLNIIAFALLLAATSVFALIAPRQGINRVPNGDFEQGTMNMTSPGNFWIPTDWSKHGAPGQEFYMWGGHDGNKRWVAWDSGSIRILNDFTLTTGLYHLSLWANLNENVDGNDNVPPVIGYFRIEVKAVTTQAILLLYDATATLQINHHQWYHLTADFAVPAAAAGDVLLSLYAGGLGGVFGILSVDDVAITAA